MKNIKNKKGAGDVMASIIRVALWIVALLVFALLLYVIYKKYPV